MTANKFHTQKERHITCEEANQSTHRLKHKQYHPEMYAKMSCSFISKHPKALLALPEHET